MKYIVFFTIFVLYAISVRSQDSIQSNIQIKNSAEKLMSTDGRLTIGGYGEVHYHQPQAEKPEITVLLMFIGW